MIMSQISRYLHVNGKTEEKEKQTINHNCVLNLINLGISTHKYRDFTLNRDAIGNLTLLFDNVKMVINELLLQQHNWHRNYHITSDQIRVGFSGCEIMEWKEKVFKVETYNLI